MTIPPDLLEPPAEPTVSPPVDPEVNELPFGEIEWAEFEKLCLRLVESEADVDSAHRFGVKGQGQEGIDIYARTSDAEWSTYQCRRVASLNETDLEAAVADFEGGEWADRATRFVLCTSRSAVKRQLAETIVQMTERLDQRSPSVVFDVWDAEVLAGRLKSHGDLVDEFFGPSWREAFLPGEARADMDARLSRIETSVAQNTRIILLDGAPEQVKEELAALAESDRELFLKLEERLGSPPSTNAAVALIADHPPWLAQPAAWRILAALTERAGEWPAAATAWERAGAGVEDASGRASLYVLAAVAASLAKLPDEELRLMNEARRSDPNHPRIALQELDQTSRGAERLEALKGIDPLSDPAVAGLLACHRALAYLLLADVPSARTEHQKAVDAIPKSAITRMVGVNVTVQQGRIASIEHRPLDYHGLLKAHVEALEVVETLRKQCRFEESVRALMLAADALVLIGERKKGLATLKSRTSDEAAASDAAEVLGDAALRAMGWREALELTDNAAQTPAIRRIRASAVAASGTFPQRKEAIETLDDFVASDGPEATLAASARLFEAFGGAPKVGWSDEAEASLRSDGFEQLAVVARALFLSHQDGAAAGYQKLDAFGDQLWARLTRMRIAMNKSDRKELPSAIASVLDLAPAQDVRVECGKALAFLGEDVPAFQQFIQVAADESVPPATRADAYAEILRLLGRKGEWDRARTMLDEWQAVRPTDERINPWAPLVASRSRSRDS